MTQSDPQTQAINTEETAADAARRFAGQVRRARQAVRTGDWEGLWAALDLRDNEPLPLMRSTELDADWGLNTEQQIRSDALLAAVRLVAGGAMRFGGIGYLLDTADDFAGYIRDGRPAADQ